MEEHFHKFMVEKGHEIDFWHKSQAVTYDLCLFTDNSSDIKILRSKYPYSKYVLLDPKMNNQRQILNAVGANLVVVSSIEQAELVAKYNKNVLVHYWFRYSNSRVDIGNNIGSPKNKIEILYHGNKIHLEAMGSTLKPALERLNLEHNIEFTAIYNIAKLGFWKKAVPKNVKVNHIQWTKEDYFRRILNSDIGVIPNFIPEIPSKLNYVLNKFNLHFKYFSGMNINKNDYSLRFKHNSNPGRIYEFAKARKSVVAEATPSMGQEIEHGISGFLVMTENGWFTAISKLIEDPKLRSDLGSNLNSRFLKRHDLETALYNFYRSLKDL
jgi:glycosyltransferase involved in cell wall biosynthesis